MAALALPLEVIAGEGLLILPLRGFSVPAEGHRHPAEVLRLLQGDDGPAAVTGLDGLVDGQLPGEQVHQALFHHVPLVVAVEYQLHGALLLTA